jgi:hypothetical protein
MNAAPAVVGWAIGRTARAISNRSNHRRPKRRHNAKYT